MKKFIFVILTFMFTIYFFNIGCTTNIDSIWEYEVGAYDRMTFTLYKDGKFIYENLNSKKKDEGIWEFNKDKTQIVICFTTEKTYWDKVFFKNDRVLVYKEDIGYYNKDKRKVGFKINTRDEPGKQYINFLGFNYYKK